MKKLTFLFLTVLCIGKIVQAQTLDEAKNFLYYDRYTSAKNALKHIIAGNKKNAEATYWLGQAYLKADEIDSARNVYQQALSSGMNDPWILVGMGHVELLEGKKDQAKQKFEQAINDSKTRKGENPDILNAVGRANADGPSTAGDPAYAIEKLKRAAELKPNDPDIYVNMGINYLKLGNDKGGDAYEAFNNALKIDPNYARAKYRLGKIFLSQNNRDKFESYFVGATESDPKYAPAYLDLYNYYSQRDVNKAKDYLEKYMANSDKDCSVDFFYADYLFRAGKYQESLDKAKAMQNGQCKNYPRLKVLFAYDYERLGDTVQAKSNVQSYLANAPQEKVQPADLLFAASLLKRFSGDEQQAIQYLTKAIAIDTVRNNQFMYMDTIASLYRKLGDLPKRVEWLKKSFETNPNPSNFDIYNLGDAALGAGNYQLADSMFSLYKSKFPDQIYGYMGLAKSAIAKDKDTTTGSAVPAVMDYINYLKKSDKEKYKGLILQNYGYLVYIDANVKKDYPAALKDLEGILEVDPENAYAKSTTEQIKKVMNANADQASGAKYKSKTTDGGKTKVKKKG
jgi:tetratricopeptide (TPR) repeat protein